MVTLFRHDERLELLRGVSLFAHCTKAELKKIESLMSIRDIPLGKVLTKQGTTGREFFVTVAGAAVVLRGNRPVARIGAGSFFGELALLDGGERTATVISKTEMVVAVLSRVEFRSLQMASPSIASTMLAEVAARLRGLYETLAVESPGALGDSRSL